MKKLESTKLTPRGINVLVSVDLEDAIKNGILVEKKLAGKTNTEYYHGEVISLGEKALEKDQCPGLEVGDQVIFNQFSGATLPTSDKYCKIILGYDIVAYSKQKDMNVDSLMPSADRILVEIIGEGASEENGIVVEETPDKRENQTQQGRIIRIGTECETKLPVGSIVFFDPYCGNLIVNEPDLKLKTINYRDILISI
jgi:co-chaperonin GroES (HSP10)